MSSFSDFSVLSPEEKCFENEKEPKRFLTFKQPSFESKKKREENEKKISFLRLHIAFAGREVWPRPYLLSSIGVVVLWFFLGNDPTAGSPTVTLLRLLLPLNDQV